MLSYKLLCIHFIGEKKESQWRWQFVLFLYPPYIFHHAGWLGQLMKHTMAHQLSIIVPVTSLDYLFHLRLQWLVMRDMSTISNIQTWHKMVKPLERFSLNKYTAPNPPHTSLQYIPRCGLQVIMSICDNLCSAVYVQVSFLRQILVK